MITNIRCAVKYFISTNIFFFKSKLGLKSGFHWLVKVPDNTNHWFEFYILDEYDTKNRKHYVPEFHLLFF